MGLIDTRYFNRTLPLLFPLKSPLSDLHWFIYHKLWSGKMYPIEDEV